MGQLTEAQMLDWIPIIVQDLWQGLNEVIPLEVIIRGAMYLTLAWLVLRTVDTVFGIGVTSGSRVAGFAKSEAASEARSDAAEAKADEKAAAVSFTQSSGKRWK